MSRIWFTKTLWSLRLVQQQAQCKVNLWRLTVNSRHAALNWINKLFNFSWTAGFKRAERTCWSGKADSLWVKTLCSVDGNYKNQSISGIWWEGLTHVKNNQIKRKTLQVTELIGAQEKLTDGDSSTQSETWKLFVVTFSFDPNIFLQPVQTAGVLVQFYNSDHFN